MKTYCLRLDKDLYKKVIQYIASLKGSMSGLTYMALQRLFEAYKDEFPDIYEVFYNRKTATKADKSKPFRIGVMLDDHVLDALEMLSEKVCVSKNELIRNALKSYFDDVPINFLSPTNIVEVPEFAVDQKGVQIAKNMTKEKHINLHCSEDLHTKFKEIAQKYNLTISDLMRILIMQFIKQEEEKEALQKQ